MKALKHILLYSLILILMNGCANKQPMENQENVSATIIALEREALELWNSGNPDGFLNLSSEDVVYIDPSLEQKLEGIEQLKTYYNRARGQVKVDRYEIVRPVVQSTSNAAVLTYNLISYIGNDAYKWNCTEVYKLNTDNQWKIIHTHWSFFQPDK